MRAALTLFHRWTGLVIAGFLFVSGVTGAIISWDHELDDLLNPHLMEARARGPALSSFELVDLLEKRDPRVEAVSFPTEVEPGESFAVFVLARRDPATGRLHPVEYNQVFLDPATGQELGRREHGAAWPVTRENFVSFLYRLHYSLHLPEFWGIDRGGQWLLGGIAILWMIDCFVGFYLTTPARYAPKPGRPAEVERRLRRSWWARWMPAWQIKTTTSPYRLHFDVHRAFGLWTWGLLFVLAFTAFSLNLYGEIFRPLMSSVSQVTPGPFDMRRPTGLNDPVVPVLGFREIFDLGKVEGAHRGWSEPVGQLFYARRWGIYGVSYFEPGEDHAGGGVGPRLLYFDGNDGRTLGERLPWKGTIADIFLQAQFPLHSGRILGLPGRILISTMGLVVAALSVTGVVIWHRKRRARLAARRGAFSTRGETVGRASTP